MHLLRWFDHVEYPDDWSECYTVIETRETDISDFIARPKSSSFLQIRPGPALAKFAARFTRFFNQPHSGCWQLKSNELCIVNVTNIRL